jgi:hypothetical protein
VKREIINEAFSFAKLSCDCFSPTATYRIEGAPRSVLFASSGTAQQQNIYSSPF